MAQQSSDTRGLSRGPVASSSHGLTDHRRSLLEARMQGKPISSGMMDLVPRVASAESVSAAEAAAASSSPVRASGGVRPPSLPGGGAVPLALQQLRYPVAGPGGASFGEPEKPGGPRVTHPSAANPMTHPLLLSGSNTSASASAIKSRGKRFSKEEDWAIVAGVRDFGKDWERIVSEKQLNRSAKQIRQRFSRIEKAQAAAQPNEASPSSPGRSSGSKGAGSRKRSRSNGRGGSPSSSGSVPPEEDERMSKRQRLRSTSVSGSREPTEAETAAASAAAAAASARISELEMQLSHVVQQRNEFESRYKSRTSRMTSLLIDMLVEQTRTAMFEERRRLKQAQARLGYITRERHGHQVVEVWQDGLEFLELQMKLARLGARKEALEKERKKLSKLKHKSKLSTGASSVPGGVKSPPVVELKPMALGGIGGGTQVLVQDETSSDAFPAGTLVSSESVVHYEEVLRLELQKAKKEEGELFHARERLEAEKHVLIRDLRRAHDEDNSPFNQQQILNSRYMLLNLLGKGGFSEVYKAFDLEELRYVACKIHQLSGHWSDEKKSNYTRHAIREYQIHHNLGHPNIVSLFDVFEIDRNSFCTVLEYCEGSDLDEVLKQRKKLPERAARSITAQIMSALTYINRLERPVIHYDLKPANILFDKFGMAKVTDFGLSKIMESEASNMELTSQGAGTYWYLPPECFVVGPSPPTISSKVDVWSVGVLLFQMLYGRKPFGNDLSQKNLLKDNVIINARQVVFPSKPQVSEEAKAFIKRCLEYSQHARPDVLTLVSDPFLRPMRSKRKSEKGSGPVPAPPSEAMSSQVMPFSSRLMSGSMHPPSSHSGSSSDSSTSSVSERLVVLDSDEPVLYAVASDADSEAGGSEELNEEDIIDVEPVSGSGSASDSDEDDEVVEIDLGSDVDSDDVRDYIEQQAAVGNVVAVERIDSESDEDESSSDSDDHEHDGEIVEIEIGSDVDEDDLREFLEQQAATGNLIAMEGESSESDDESDDGEQELVTIEIGSDVDEDELNAFLEEQVAAGNLVAVEGESTDDDETDSESESGVIEIEVGSDVDSEEIEGLLLEHAAAREAEDVAAAASGRRTRKRRRGSDDAGDLRSPKRQSALAGAIADAILSSVQKQAREDAGESSSSSTEDEDEFDEEVTRGDLEDLRKRKEILVALVESAEAAVYAGRRVAKACRKSKEELDMFAMRTLGELINNINNELAEPAEFLEFDLPVYSVRAQVFANEAAAAFEMLMMTTGPGKVAETVVHLCDTLDAVVYALEQYNKLIEA
ncbi:uncharacterized protein AMSG_11754 [Thecamonas trahens ATCC 50062]|uniref:Protein kinase domain-containing protein n=1 Tax=Thecamonas trahens ATCC 50062 TaxID=461836 RepID=A0A0L0D5Z6_THETB|nr:hypothetical protein AMSG_11754 [Thecamonas trahens ATCC 50062]KNC46733.1 hypothetical protein AMSG_11754 [Thecamonas trahens ATCC 50062]|eukprot:XP_013760252.1 hypothetical protein AMSG_11754 [Thecamonas trahens ATCC 50062]